MATGLDQHIKVTLVGFVGVQTLRRGGGVDGVVGARTPRGNTGDHYYADAVIAAVYVLYEGVAEDHGQLARSEGDVDI